MKLKPSSESLLLIHHHLLGMAGRRCRCSLWRHALTTDHWRRTALLHRWRGRRHHSRCLCIVFVTDRLWRNTLTMNMHNYTCTLYMFEYDHITATEFVDYKLFSSWTQSSNCLQFLELTWWTKSNSAGKASSQNSHGIIAQSAPFKSESLKQK